MSENAKVIKEFFSRKYTSPLLRYRRLGYFNITKDNFYFPNNDKSIPPFIVLFPNSNREFEMRLDSLNVNRGMQKEIQRRIATMNGLPNLVNSGNSYFIILDLSEEHRRSLCNYKFSDKYIEEYIHLLKSIDDPSIPVENRISFVSVNGIEKGDVVAYCKKGTTQVGYGIVDGTYPEDNMISIRGFGEYNFNSISVSSYIIFKVFKFKKDQYKLKDYRKSVELFGNERQKRLIFNSYNNLPENERTLFGHISTQVCEKDEVSRYILNTNFNISNFTKFAREDFEPEYVEIDIKNKIFMFPKKGDNKLLKVNKNYPTLTKNKQYTILSLICPESRLCSKTKVLVSDDNNKKILVPLNNFKIEYEIFSGPDKG